MKFSAVFALCCIVLLLAANIETKQFENSELASFTDFAVANHLFAPGKAIKGVGKVVKGANKAADMYNKVKASFKSQNAPNHQGIGAMLKNAAKKVIAIAPKIKDGFKKPTSSHGSALPKKLFANGKALVPVKILSIIKKPFPSGKGPTKVSVASIDQDEN